MLLLIQIVVAVIDKVLTVSGHGLLSCDAV